MTNDTKRPGLDRRDVIRCILSGKDDVLAVGGLGNAGYDLVAARGEHPLNFTIHGAGMGGAPVLGLGLALAQPSRRVVVVLGDGDMLMGVGSLATIAAQKPANLAIVVMDNEMYQETGAQATATGFGVDLAGMAAAAGFPVVLRLDDQTHIAEAVDKVLRAPGPVFVNVKISDVPVPQLPKERDGVLMKLRFREKLAVE